MPLQTSGPISLGNVQTEFGGTNPIAMSEYYAGGANVPSGATGTNGAIPTSGTISMSKFYGSVKTAFSPAGGTSAGSPQALSDFGTYDASVTITCTTPATWTWTRSGDTNATATVSSGGSSTSITFNLSTTGFTYRQSTFTVSGTSNGITRYYTVTLTAEGIA
jgi:hypothetical protein